MFSQEGIRALNKIKKYFMCKRFWSNITFTSNFTFPATDYGARQKEAIK